TKDSSHGNPVQLVIVVKTAKSAHIIAKSGAAVILLWRFASQRTAMLRLRLIVLATLLAIGANAEAAIKAIKFGKLWDGHRTIANAVIIIENDKIQSVAANAPIPAGAEIIDLSRYTGMPGMIDVHTHLTYYWDPASGTNPRRQPPRHVAVTVFLAQASARKTLRSEEHTSELQS